MLSFEWIVTVVGAVLCVVYSWFLGIMGRSQEMPIGKISLPIGIVGILILASMAIVGPVQNVEPKGMYLMDNKHLDPANVKSRSLMVRTIRKAGRRPDRNHLPYECSDGRLAWVTKEEYRKLKKGE